MMILFLIQVIVMVQGVQCLFHLLVLRVIIGVKGLVLECRKMLRSVKRGEDGPLVVKGLRILRMLKSGKGQRKMMTFG